MSARPTKRYSGAISGVRPRRRPIGAVLIIAELVGEAWSMAVASVQFLTIVLVAASLVPGGAHLLEFRAKMAFDRDDYLRVQRLYRGWAFAAIPLLGSLVSALWLAALTRSQPLACGLALAAFALMATTVAIFFVRIFPANKATSDWTELDEDWRTLRRRWERGHAVNALITFAALLVAVAAALGV